MQTEESKRKIRLVMPELFWGGAETQFRYLISEIDKKSFDLEVIVEHSKRAKNDQDQRFIDENEKEVLFHEPLGTEAPTASLFERRRRLKRYYDELERGLIVIYGGVSLLLIPWLRSRGFTVCYSDRNGEEDSLRQRIKRAFYAKANALICNSKPTYARRSKVHDHVVYIPNGTKTHSERTRSSYASNNILMISRVAKVKNIECAIRSLKTLPEDFSITLIGKTEDSEYEQQLENLTRELGVSSRFVFAGYSGKVSEYLEEAFCTILSSYEEGMPNAVLESWSHERISVVSDIPANAALVEETDLRFPCDSPESLAHCIMRLKAFDKKTFDALCREYRVRAEECYSIRSMVKRYEVLFGSLPY